MRNSFFLAAGLLVASAAAADVEIRTIRKHFEVDAEHEILLDVPIGTVIIEAGEPGRVDIEIVVSCSGRSARCRQRAEEVYLDESLRRRSLALDVRGLSNKLTSRPSVDIVLTLPADNDLEVDLGVGELQTQDLRGDLELDIGVGEVDIFAAEEAIGTIRLSVGVGSADIYPRRRNQADSGFLFLGNEVYWNDGPGEAYVVIDVGVGEINVTLE